MKGNRERVPREAHILKLAESVKDSTHGLWDFGREYYILNQDADFNYRGLARAVKDQYGVDLYPPSVATKLRKAYETFVVKAEISMDVIRQYSPYYLYELSVVVDITKKNAPDWLKRVKTTSRADLMEEITGRGEGNGKPAPKAMLRIDENVFDRLLEAQQHLSASVGQTLSTIVFMEFITELILNTQGTRLRKLWLIMHGEQEDG